MSNENKTALTAEEINLKANEVCSNKDELYGYRIGYLEGRKDASLQTKEKDKEIEELKTSIEGVFGWREKNHHLTISEKQLKSQLSEVTKERDELREGIKTIYENAYYKPHSDSLGEINTICERLITPNKEEREEGKQWICNSCNAPNFTQSVSQDEIDNETLSCISCGGFEFHLK